MKDLIQKTGFSPKENTKGIFIKKYSGFDNYVIEVDFENKKINYGEKIKSERATTQNFFDDENWVVLECVDRLLTKGYKPEDIVLEKKFTVGHGASGGWLDILVKKNNKAYLMIECKTWGAEFEKELSNTYKKGGQLFTYFQQDNSAELLVLYASRFSKGKIEYINKIIQIDDTYQGASNVEDLFTRWDGLASDNGVFESWVKAYHFENRSLTKKDLKPLTEQDSGFIFNAFASILRRHTVSDKSNAFNKIFNLFLAKLFDEKKDENTKLEFQWEEGVDNEVSFQVKLINLYKGGMNEFLKKEVEGIEDSDFRYNTAEELEQKKRKILKFNNVFAIKEVVDEESFMDNFRVLKDVVKLLQSYQIRYPRKQQHLSDFFERLLTTGLKQEVGQFFTPPPIAKFIVRSMPFQEIIKEKLEKGNSNELLPAVLDYAAGSGHFLTESMEEIQTILDNLEADKLNLLSDAKKKLQIWNIDKYDWAKNFIYGIEKDYRLVKVAKVGCYFYGDGLAQVVHGDGLDSFRESINYRGLLKDNSIKAPDDITSDFPQFDLILANPPYSVNDFKLDLKNKKAAQDFKLYKNLTDKSKEIECLFVERAKQLLKDGGIAGIILPSSILSNAGIYTKTREIILKYFEIIGITQFGSGTFMATGTNTVVLFLRRGKNKIWQNIKNSIDKFFVEFQDITVKKQENIFSKYVNYVWEDLDLTDFISLCKKTPNEKIKNHEIFSEYNKKLKAKNEEDLYHQIIEIEKEKLLYFILAFGQKVVLTETGNTKNDLKKFLGYEFSSAKRKEGIHPIQRGKSIDECTSLFDPESQENPEKASFYTYKNFIGEDFEIDESMRKNVSVIDLVDMMTFDRKDFEKSINLSVKKKIKYENIWKTEKLVVLGEIADIQKGTSITSAKIEKGEIPVVAGGQNPAYFHNKSNRDGNIVTVSASGAYSGFVNYFSEPIFASDSNTIKSKDENQISTKLIFEFLKSIQFEIYTLQRGQAQPHVYGEDLAKIKIPLPPKDIQEKIVKEIEEIEKRDEENKERVEGLKSEVEKIIEKTSGKLTRLGDITTKIGSGATPRGGEGVYQSSGISFIRSQNVYDNVFTRKGLAFINKEQAMSLDNVSVEKDDILFNITGASIARCCIAEDKYLPARVNQHVSIIRTNNEVLSKYIQRVLINPKYKNKLLQIGEGATSRQAITKSQLEEFQIPLPPLSEQQKIVVQIEKIEQEIESLEKEMENSKKEKEEVLRRYL